MNPSLARIVQTWVLGLGAASVRARWYYMDRKQPDVKPTRYYMRA
jgi:hypothetical protein